MPAAWFLAVLSSVALAQGELSSIRIADVPHIRQKPDFCGEACAAMALQARGVKVGGRPVNQDDVFALTGLDPALGRGAYTKELKVALEAAGYEVGPVWSQVPAQDEAAIDAAWRVIYDDLWRGVPSIVCMHFDGSPDTTEHFRLILGYDAETDDVLYHEPAARDGAYQRMQRRTFLSLWPLKYHPKQWTLVRFALAGADLDTSLDPVKVRHADMAQTVIAMNQQAGEGFHTFLAPPFVVSGDGKESDVKRRAQGTVAWATAQLKADYFPNDPAEPVPVWLFKNPYSYESHVFAWLGDTPSTPYGFATEDGLYMDISTGGGTLVHELVHPLMAANFPDCPPWFNEGLASLYEHVGQEDGRIYGYLNWRLPGLQAAIRRDAVPPLTQLMRFDENAFYNDDSGVNYAASRYLLYYLQERKLLRTYYKQWRNNQHNDPHGIVALQKVLGTQDLDAFQDTWQRWVAALKK